MDGYWANMMPIHAHRWVWINHHGAIPKGMDIHHKDGDKSNNEIENLEMLSRSDHLKRHWQEGRFDLDSRRIQLAEARKWLKTKEGREKQSISSKEAWKKRKQTKLNCIQCQKEVVTSQPWTKFCGANCEKRYARVHRPNKVEIKCLMCGKVSFKDRYAPTRFCSQVCGGIHSASERNRKR